MEVDSSLPKSYLVVAPRRQQQDAVSGSASQQTRMFHPLLDLKPRRRRFMPEDEFFLEGNFERCSQFQAIGNLIDSTSPMETSLPAPAVVSTVAGSLHGSSSSASIAFSQSSKASFSLFVPRQSAKGKNMKSKAKAAPEASGQRLLPTADSSSHFNPMKSTISNVTLVNPFVEIVKCHEPGCEQTFHSLLQLEKHMFQNHQHRCSVCGKSLSSERLLSMHISELHDQYFALLSHKKPSFECVVEGCLVRCWDNEERRNHLQIDHRFPKAYDFHHPERFRRKANKERGKEVLHSVVKHHHHHHDQQQQEQGQQQLQKEEEGVEEMEFGEISAGLGNESVRDHSGTVQRSAVSPLLGERTLILVREKENRLFGEKNLPNVMSGKVTEKGRSRGEDDSELGADGGEEMLGGDDVGDSADSLAMDVITESLRKTSIKVPEKITFGRKAPKMRATRHGIGSSKTHTSN